MVSESTLPDFHFGVKVESKSVRESTFYQLDCALQSYVHRRQNQMEVVRHKDKLVKQICCSAAIEIKSFDKK